MLIEIVRAHPAGNLLVVSHKATIVFDHFRTIKLANEKIDDLRRTLQRESGHQETEPRPP